jgi:hypothetical protein
MVEENHILTPENLTFHPGKARNLIVAPCLDARRKRYVGAPAPGAHAKGDWIGDLHALMVPRNHQIGDCAFTPMTLNGVESRTVPHVPARFEEGIDELGERSLVFIKGSIKRDMQQPCGAPEPLVVVAKLYNSKRSIGLPIAFEALEDIQAPGDGFAANVEGGLIPWAKGSAHIHIFWFL